MKDIINAIEQRKNIMGAKQQTYAFKSGNTYIYSKVILNSNKNN